MPLAAYTAIFFTVVLLVTTAYFLMGGLPLLVLQHDTPLDQRFIQRFFEVYYRAALFAAAGATLSFALWGRWPFALGAAGIAAVAAVLRRRILPAMADIGARIQARDAAAVARFRRAHALALFANVAQLVVLVWGVTQLSL